MLIENENKFVNQINHKGSTHKVVEGIADVPDEVAKYLLSFPGWAKVVVPIEQKILDELHKTKDEIEAKGKKTDK
jgi:hypothetical protein